MKNVLLLSGHDIDILKDSVLNAEISDVYKKGFFIKIFKRFKKLLPYTFREWKKHLERYDLIILFDTYYNDGIIDYIHKLNSNSRIVLYCWNSIREISSRVNIDRILNDTRIEIWSYNKMDCIKYSLKYNPQFWNTNLLNNDNCCNNIYDITFIGSPKKRLNILEKMNDFCNENHLNSYFYITNYECEFNKNKNNEFMDYSVYVNDVACRSACILDLVTDDNYGLPLRPLESLFLKKKLITNYKEIIHEPFYNSNNIYILDEDNRDLKKFLNTPVADIDKSIVNYYDCKSWFKRFVDR